jgi:signal transduction histidine kinase
VTNPAEIISNRTTFFQTLTGGIDARQILQAFDMMSLRQNEHVDPNRHLEKSLTELTVADEREPSIATMRPTLRQRRLAYTVVALVAVGFGAVAPFASDQLVRIDSFVPTIQAIIFVTDFTTAILLFSQFSILDSRELLLLASGYLFSAFIVIPHTLSYPGAFAPKGLLVSGLQTTPWLYTFWHFGFSAVVLVYACLTSTNPRKFFIRNSGMLAIWVSTAIVVALVCVLTWGAVAEESYLPPLIADNVVSFTPLANYVTTISLLTSLLAFIVLWIRQRSVLDLWLLVAIFATVVEQAVVSLFIASRFSVGFYSSRMFSVIVSTVVLSALLSESVSVYVSLYRANRMLRRERENKLMTLEAAIAVITHEVRQPLTGITAKSAAARRFLRREPPDINRAQAILDEVESAGFRADEVLKSVGALFERSNWEQEPIDVNELALEAILILQRELAQNSIVVNTQLTEQLPLIVGHRGQLQEVLLNLVQNSIDAMITVADKSRVLHIGTELHGETIAISVDDSGPGIDPKKMTSIFDPFVTTKAKGMGLGLALSHMIIERHGGQISVLPGPNGGAHFRITIPIKPTPPQA